MKKNTAFDKFMSKEKKGAAKKEQIRQDKRKWKKDQQERFKAKDAGHRGQDPRYKSSRPGKGEGAAQEARNRPAPRSFNEGRGERVQKPRTVDKVGKPKLHLKKDDREENFKKKPSIIVKPVRTGDGREEPVEKQQRANDSKGPKLQLKRGDRKVGLEKSKDQKPQASSKETSGQASHMPLNKYIAHCGICSRRDAVEIIKGGNLLHPAKIEKAAH